MSESKPHKPDSLLSPEQIERERAELLRLDEITCLVDIALHKRFGDEYTRYNTSRDEDVPPNLLDNPSSRLDDKTLTETLYYDITSLEDELLKAGSLDKVIQLAKHYGVNLETEDIEKAKFEAKNMKINPINNLLN